VVAARAVAEALVELLAEPEPTCRRSRSRVRARSGSSSWLLLAEHRGESLEISETTEFFPEGDVYDSDAPLPGPRAKLVGPTYEEWLKSA